jgi:hypothetical protein
MAILYAVSQRFGDHQIQGERTYLLRSEACQDNNATRWPLSGLCRHHDLLFDFDSDGLQYTGPLAFCVHYKLSAHPLHFES